MMDGMHGVVVLKCHGSFTLGLLRLHRIYLIHPPNPARLRHGLVSGVSNLSEQGKELPEGIPLHLGLKKTGLPLQNTSDFSPIPIPEAQLVHSAATSTTRRLSLTVGEQGGKKEGAKEVVRFQTISLHMEFRIFTILETNPAPCKPS